MAVAEADIARVKNDQELLADDVHLRNLVLNAAGSAITDIDIDESTITGEVMRTMEGASQISLTAHDFGRAVTRSASLQDAEGKLRTIDIKLDGLDYRLARMSKQGDDVVFTFEDRFVSRLRAKKGPRKLGRRGKGTTRAEAILLLVRSVKAEKIPVRIHELHKTQPLRRPSKREKREQRDKDRKQGFPSDFSMSGVTKPMLKQINTCLEVAEEVGANERATLAMLVAGFGESGFDPSQTDFATHTHKGVFQSNQIPQYDTAQQAKYFLIGGRSFRDGAIKTVRQHPNWTVGMVAEWVEVSGAGGNHYQQHFSKARKLLDAWGGVSESGGKDHTKTVRKPYQFRVQKKESYWAAIQRMAGEVHWRAFVSGGVFHYISEEDLFKSRPRFTLSERHDGVVNIDFDYDYRKKAQRATATVRINRYQIPPGTTIMLEDMGPANGKWLVLSTTRNLFSAEATVELKKPMQEWGEPRNETKEKRVKKDGPEYGHGGLYTGDLKYPANVRGSYIGGPAAHASRAWGNWQSDNAVDIGFPVGTNLYAVQDGVVVKLGGSWSGGSGNPDGYNITIKSNNRYWFYTHLKARHKDIKVGARVKAGQYVGESGAANGVPHLHLGTAVTMGEGKPYKENPAKMLGWEGGKAPDFRGRSKGKGPTPKKNTLGPN